MHRDKPFRIQFLEYLDRLVRSHMNAPKRIRKICADRQNRDLRLQPFSNLLKTIRISAIPRVVKFASLVLEQKSTETALFIAKMFSAPMMTRRQRHAPILVLKTLPPLQFDHSLKSQTAGQL